MHAPIHQLASLPLVHRLLPGLKDLGTQYHVGNYVIVRATGERIRKRIRRSSIVQRLPVMRNAMQMKGIVRSRH
ncbi:hypothetical protein OH76DRAFT_1409876, partial [Lentinus brumalis]